VAAKAARGEVRAMAKRARMAVECSEHCAAFVSLVVVLDGETRHAERVASRRQRDIRSAP
jgi:6,7-dimethyl-8-ribityllumazine synthase